MTAVYLDMTPAEIEAQYFLRGTRPGYEERDIPRWIEDSVSFRAKADGTLDLRYGDYPRNLLDVFRTDNSLGTILYIHGGYWQRGDKSVYSFVARPFLVAGFDVVLVNYQMCPDVRMHEIAPQIREAVSWLFRAQSEIGINLESLHIMGHSAGGHLTAEMMATNWSVTNPAIPASQIRTGIAISGIYDFEPILYCSENDGLRMDAAEARAVSTYLRSPEMMGKMLFAYGLKEPADMHRQSKSIYKKWAGSLDRAELLGIPNADHFETVDVLADEHSELFRTILGFIGA